MTITLWPPLSPTITDATVGLCFKHISTVRCEVWRVLTLIKAHILKHLSIIPQNAQTKDVVLMIVVPLDAPLEEIKTFLHGYLSLRKLQSKILIEDGLTTMHCCSSLLNAVPTQDNM